MRYYFIFASKIFIFGLLASLALLLPGQSQALTISSARDCDDNAIIRCGALTPEELGIKYKSSGMGPVYARFGITGKEVSAMGDTAVAGTVTKTGNVIVDGQIVATDAVTAGRQNMDGSAEQSSGGIIFYERAPSVSFASASLPAFVVMQNGKFSFAIIASCGNPVKATPVTQPTPTPVPKPTPQPKTPVTPAVTPPSPPATAPTPTNINITNTNTQSQSQSQSQAGGMGGGTTTTAPAPTQPVAAASSTSTTPTTAAQSQASTSAAQATPAPVAVVSDSGKATTLPNTGPGSIVALSGISSVFGTIGHYVYNRRRSFAS